MTTIMMSSDLVNTSNSLRYFSFIWFRFPIEPEENITVIEVLDDILLVTTFLLNIILLWMIWKNPDKKPRNHRALLLANLSVINVFAALFGFVLMVEHRTELFNTTWSYKAGAIMFSLLLPKYYPSMFFLTLIQYAMIVKPLKFRSIDPSKVKTTKTFLVIQWVVTTVVLIITPICYENFDKYLKGLVMVSVCLSWIVTAGIAWMYIRILQTLWKRQNDFKRRFNVSETEQGAVALRQNRRLARVLFFFIVTLVLFSLPSNTAYLFILYCPQCNQRALVKACLYSLPLFIALPTIHSVHWLIGTPSYCKELKRLARKILVFCRCAKVN